MQMLVASTVPGDVYVVPPEVVCDVGHGSLKKGEHAGSAA